MKNWRQENVSSKWKDKKKVIENAAKVPEQFLENVDDISKVAYAVYTTGKVLQERPGIKRIEKKEKQTRWKQMIKKNGRETEGTSTTANKNKISSFNIFCLTEVSILVFVEETNG